MPAETVVPVRPAAVAVDLGSQTAGVWSTHHGTVSGEANSGSGRLVRRGRVVDADGCVALLTELVRQFPQPVARGGVVVACKPVLTSGDEQDVTRRVLEKVFAPSRIHFIDSVRAAALGSGATSGRLLVADVGAELTEVALLDQGRAVAARRTEIGTRDLDSGATVDLISDVVARHIDNLDADLDAARKRGMLLVGDGATHPELAATLSRELGIRVHRAAAPRLAAVNGAGIAAMSLLRHPALR